MATVAFPCPYCHSELEADADFAGGRATCPACDRQVLVPAPGLAPGMTLGNYRLERRLGIGGMGEVFLATHTPMDRRVALKVLPPAMTRNPRFVERFLHEARTAAKLEHPHIVAAFDAGEAQGYYYLAMAYIEGEDLEDRLERCRSLPEPEVLHIALALADALADAWDKHRLLHRDIKPANIMVTAAGEVKLMDMGIAKSLAEDSSLTQAGTMLGTPYYISPEQAKGEAGIDCRADIYSLGATMFHLLTGSCPYSGDTAVSVLLKHLHEPVPLACDSAAAVSRPLSLLIQRMLAKRPADRPANWSELRTALAALAGAPPAAAPRSPAREPTLQLRASQECRSPAAPPPADLPPDATLTVRPRTAPVPAVPPDATVASPPPTAAPAPSLVESLPPSPALPGGLKLALQVGAALIVVILALGAWALYHNETAKHEQRRLERQLQEKQAELQEKNVVGEVEKGLAAIQKQAEVAETEKQRLRQLEDMYKAALAGWQQDPGDHAGAAQAMNLVRERAQGTRFELLAVEQLRQIEQARQQAETTMRALAGEWVSTRLSGPQAPADVREMRFVFGPGRQFRWEVLRRQATAAQAGSGSYTLGGGRLCFLLPGSAPSCRSYELNGNTLLLHHPDGYTIELRKP